ncbi:MAG TPA: alpha/beta hydrolase-fold protein [Pyrinomonadaceae bacterium]|nr:alpha/beta hydrolase-fold protein [Pyrinomonadaceae bacterium]
MDVKSRRPFGFVLCFGGFEFGNIIPTRVIMDNLIAAGKIPPTLVVLVDNVDAKSEQGGYASTIQFLADELLPQLRKQYNLTAEPDKAVIAGTSRRGLVAAIVGFRRPEIFGGVLSMSGAFFWRPGKDAEYEWLAAQFAANPTRRPKLYLTVGLLETVVTPGNAGHYMLATNRHLRNVLQAKGYRFKMTEFYGGHEDSNWQGGFADGLIYLLGRKDYRSTQ